MKWFEGTIPNAIQAAKQKRAIFVVYISGQDDLSKQMDLTWEDEQVTQLCHAEDFVAVKLQANSETCAQFSMIYPVVCVPSTFYIGVNGVPLEVTGGHLEPKDFLDKTRKVMQTHKDQLPPQPATNPSTADLPSSAAASSDASTAAAAPSAATPPAAASSEPSTSMASETRDKNLEIERAQELRIRLRKEKEKKEQEKERQKEIERRELQRGVEKLKKTQEEQQKKEMMSEWKKERDDKKKEKERIKESIARDRAEKAEQFNKQKADRDQVTEETKRVKLDLKEAAKVREEENKRETARLQFRLPDGSNITHQFPSSATLEETRTFVTQNVGNKFGAFTMSCTWPKRDFQSEDYSKTLLDLDLTPSAAIIILPGSRLTVSRSGGDQGRGEGFLWMLLAPFLALWNFILSLLFSAPARPRGAYNQETPGEAPSGDQPGATASTSTASQVRNRQRPASSQGLRSQQQGNIRRFTADDEDDEDMANWNGNSTQQM